MKVKPAEIPKTWDEPIAGLRPRFEYQYIFAAKKHIPFLMGLMKMFHRPMAHPDLTLRVNFFGVRMQRRDP